MAIDTKITSPTFITRYYRHGDHPFTTTCDMDTAVAEDLLANEDGWRGDGTYLAARLALDSWPRESFLKKGGQPRRKHPIYAALGTCWRWEEENHRGIRLPLAIFPPESISFTYMDSMRTDRGPYPQVYTLGELAAMFQDTRTKAPDPRDVPEVQIWDDEPIRTFLAGRRMEIGGDEAS